MTSVRHVMVTGGSRGLGLAMVRTLLAAGYVVSTCSRRISADLRTLTDDPQLAGRLFTGECEVGNGTAVEAFVDAAMQWAGDRGLYGLVNNAGVARAGILASFPNTETEDMIRINLIGALQMARAATPHLIRNGCGRIINISSIIGSRGYNGLAAYSASKAGMDGMTRALARELGRRQITVNSLAPGYVKTEMSATLSSSQLAQITNRTPLGRLATESDICGVLMFLLGDAAAMVTGQTLLVDGGVSC